MVDHGCDAYAMGFFSLILMKVVQAGDNILTMICINSSVFGFYVSTLEHYYTGHHNIGNGNAAADGPTAVIILFIVVAFMGNEIFTD